MQQSHLNKIAEAYNKIAEGKEPCPVHEKKDEKKKMHKCTCDESFYYKRLQAMNPEMAEMYLEIAEELVDEGYESSRLLDNIIEALSKEFVGHEFRSALTAVNPRIYENLQTAEKKQARVIAASFAEQRSCWKTHKKVGMKMKGGKLVNDCRPKNEEVEHVEEGATEVAMSNKETTLQKKKNKIDMMISRERNKELMKKEETVVEEAYTVTNADKKGNTKAYQNYKAGMKGKDGKPLYKAADHMKEATYPSDFKNPDGSTRSVAKKKTGRPNAQGDYGKKDINEQDAADAKRMSTFQKLQKNVDQKKKLNIRGNDSAEQKKRLEKKRGMKLDDHPQFKKEEVELEEKKKDDSYLETDMKKRQANNEKARKDMEKMGTSMKNPHFEDVNYYDVILAYLDENNLMESVEEAEEIMMQLTGAQIVEIIDEFMNSKEESK